MSSLTNTTRHVLRSATLSASFRVDKKDRWAHINIIGLDRNGNIEPENEVRDFSCTVKFARRYYRLLLKRLGFSVYY